MDIDPEEMAMLTFQLIGLALLALFIGPMVTRDHRLSDR